jgi:hypothetical protein
VAAGPRWAAKESWAAAREQDERWRSGPAGLLRFVSSFFSISDFYFQTYLNSKHISNSNQNLNPNTQKQCISMYATVNSYISLIN